MNGTMLRIMDITENIEVNPQNSALTMPVLPTHVSQAHTFPDMHLYQVHHGGPSLSASSGLTSSDRTGQAGRARELGLPGCRPELGPKGTQHMHNQASFSLAGTHKMSHRFPEA